MPLRIMDTSTSHVHPAGMYVTGVPLIGMHRIGVPLTGVSRPGVYLSMISPYQVRDFSADNTHRPRDTASRLSLASGQPSARNSAHLSSYIRAGRGGTAGGTTGRATGATADGTEVSAGDCGQADECLPWRVHRLLTGPPYSERNKLNFTPQTNLCVSIDSYEPGLHYALQLVKKNLL